MKRFLIWNFSSFLEGGFIFITMYFITDNNNYDSNKDWNFNIFSIVIMSTIVIAQNIRLLYIVHRFSFWNIFGIFMSVFLFFMYMLATNRIEIFGFLYGIEETLEIWTFWSILICFIGVYLVGVNTYFGIKRFFYPGIKDKIRKIYYKPNEMQFLESLENWREDDLIKNTQNKIFR